MPKWEANLITVAILEPNAGTFAAQPFAVMSATPVATVLGTAISNTADGNGNHVLSLKGTDFVSGSTIDWNGVSLTTSYVSPWAITATITPADYTARPAMLTVMNPAGASAGFELQ
jgi:hypothetical protein